MSTYYYLVCDAHRVMSGVIGGRSFPDRWWGEDDRVAPFLREHAECLPNPRLVSEHDDVTLEYDAMPVEEDE